MGEKAHCHHWKWCCCWCQQQQLGPTRCGGLKEHGRDRAEGESECNFFPMEVAMEAIDCSPSRELQPPPWITAGVQALAIQTGTSLQTSSYDSW